MDYKRNKHFFDPGFSRKLTIIAICGIFLALVFFALWWYIWISSIVSTLFTIGVIVGAGMTIGALSIRPKAKDVTEQIDSARKTFVDTTAEKLKYPDDFEENSLSVWGFREGTTAKTLKNGEKYTDCVEFASLYLRRSTLYARTEIVSLLKEDISTAEFALSLASMEIKADESTLTLLITSTDESLIIPIQAIDYSLEQFIEKVERQIRKAV